MPITSSNFAKALWPGVNSWYGKAYDEFPVEYTELFETNQSSKGYEEDVGVSGFGLAKVKPEGGAIDYDTESQAFVTRYAHTVWGLGFVITREIYEDDQYGIVGKRRAEGLAFSMRQTKEINGANIFNRGFNSSYVGGDGVSLFNSAHPKYAGGTQSNILSVASDLSETALEQACKDIAKLTNDRGLRISILPWKLVIPTDLQFEAERILKTEQRSGTANNDINALKSTGRFPGGVVMNHYLTDQDAWFIQTNVKGSTKYWSRWPMKFGIDNDFDTENAKYKAVERYSFGWTDYLGWYGTPGA